MVRFEHTLPVVSNQAPISILFLRLKQKIVGCVGDAPFIPANIPIAN